MVSVHDFALFIFHGHRIPLNSYWSAISVLIKDLELIIYCISTLTSIKDERVEIRRWVIKKPNLAYPPTNKKSPRTLSSETRKIAERNAVIFFESTLNRVFIYTTESASRTQKEDGEKNG